MKFLRPRRPVEVTDPDEHRQAREKAAAQARRITAVLPALIDARERNHFADRLAAAYREAPR